MSDVSDRAGQPAGAVLFARYAFPPNELGYCGPEDPDVLLRHATAPAAGTSAEVRRRAEQFDGAWAYLELIAAAAGIADPLDARVVEAYWIGNSLLDQVDPEAFVAALGERFAGELVRAARPRWTRIPPEAAAAHHSFHVFAVYPWVDLLTRATPPRRAEIAVGVLDQCRIRWGTVTARTGDRLLVRARPLVWDGHRLGLGAERIEPVRWTSAGQQRPDPPEPGELVSCHWDWVCDRLTEEQAAQLAARSDQQVAAANRTS